jgi:hypothetical protein
VKIFFMTKPRRPKDSNQLAKLIVDIATGQTTESDPYEGKNRQKAENGKLGGLKGGIERAKRLNAKERTDIAKQGAFKRWNP